jgi:RNA polymerase sigma-70 factor (ECF subfamily)
MISEKQIIEDCLKGKKRAFRQLYLRYSGVMLGVCMRYARNTSEAEDILQDGFVKVFQNISSFGFKGSFEGWIKRIMINTALNHNRNNLKHYFHSDVDEVEEYTVIDSDVVIDKQEYPISTDELMKMIQALPPGYKTVFNLYVFEGYSHKEIADMLEISENTSKSQLSKARKYLKNKINKATS